MTPEELEATVLAQGCLLLALADKETQPDELITALLGKRIARTNAGFADSDEDARKAFESAYRKLMARLMPGRSR